MQIKNIHLVNYRGMEDLTVEFGPGVNLIIGDNGAGKSSLLSGVAVALGRMFSYVDGVKIEFIKKEDVRVTSTTVGDATVSMKYHRPVKVEFNLDFCCAEYYYCYESDGGSGGTVESRSRINTGNGPLLQRKMEKLVNDTSSTLPLLNYQSDRRNLFRTAKKKKNFVIEEIERRKGYQSCLNGKPAFDDVQNWCFQMEFNRFRSGHEVAEYDLFREIVSRFVKELEGETITPKIRFDPQQSQLIYSEDRTEQLIYNLSAGYQSILCLIMELAYRTALLNPRLDDLKSLEGVVLIDEIDMHLHPRWQWKILGALRATFPNVQFIIATHSPIVISSAEDAKLILMESPNKVKYLPDAYGYNIDDVLELTQGSVNMPQEVKNWRKEIEQALDENDLPKAEGIVKAAEEKLGKDSTTVARMKDFLEVNKWIVEE